MEGLLEGFFDALCALRLAPASGPCVSVPGSVVFWLEPEAGLNCSGLDDPAVFAVDSEREFGCWLLDDPAVLPADPETLAVADCSALADPRPPWVKQSDAMMIWCQLDGGLDKRL